MFFQNIIKIFKIKDLRSRLLVVIAVLILFRIMANIPVPGVDTARLKNFFDQSEVFGLINVFSGGTLQNLSIVMLGLGPYITATVVLQLLSMIFPQLEKIYKEEGEAGREKFNQYGRMLAVPLSIFQSYSMLILFQKQGVIGEMSTMLVFSSIITITAGTLFLMWLGELIDEKGIGNGVSMLIFAGIISQFPQNFLQTYLGLKFDPSQTLSFGAFFTSVLLIIFAVVLITEAKRNIPVSYARRVRGRKMYGGAKSQLPLNINPGGVMPIIFALSLLTFPSMIANFFVGAEGIIGQIAQKVVELSQNYFIYSAFYFVLVFAFTFFYTMIVFDPNTVADNLKKMGGFIPGCRPGQPTVKFISHTLNHLLPIGALFLGVVALAPSLVGRLTGIASFEFLVGGTSLLILVSVILETYQEINAYLQMQEL